MSEMVEMCLKCVSKHVSKMFSFVLFTFSFSKQCFFKKTQSWQDVDQAFCYLCHMQNKVPSTYRQNEILQRMPMHGVFRMQVRTLSFRFSIGTMGRG